MKIGRFLKTWEGTRAENRFGRVLVLLLVLVNLVTGVAAMRAERTVVLVPPHLDRRVSIARNKADAEVKKGWALYLTELIGNITPGNIDFVKSAIDPLLSASIRADVIGVMATQMNAIRLERTTISFRPRQVIYEASTDKAFVTGIQTVKGPGSRPQSRARTYEYTVKYRGYSPLITYIDVYAGPPKTVEYLSTNKGAKS